MGDLERKKHEFKMQVQEILSNAILFAKKKDNAYVTLEHFLFALMDNDFVAGPFRKLDIDVDELLKDIDAHLDKDPKGCGARPVMTEHTILTVQRCVAQIMLMSDECKFGIVIFSFFFTFFNYKNAHARYFCRKHGITSDVIESIFGLDVESSHLKSDMEKLDASPLSSHIGKIARNLHNSGQRRKRAKKNALNVFCTDMTSEDCAGKIGNLVGRSDEMKFLLQGLSRKKRNNVILVGDPGVGKTAMVEGFATMLRNGKLPESFRNCRIYKIDILKLISGTKYRGELEDRINGIVENLKKEDRVFLFMDNMHEMMHVQKSDVPLASLFSSAMDSERIGVIGTTIPEFHRKIISKDGIISKRFQKVTLKEPSLSETKKIIKGVAAEYEKFHGLGMDDEVIDSAIELSSKFMKSRKMPDKALDVIDSAMSMQRMHPGKGERSATSLLRASVERACSRMANVPMDVMIRVRNTGRNAIDLEKGMGRAVFGQDEAAKALSDAVYVSMAGLKDPNRPMGCFLFSGPTGVGKTEMARRLAECMDMKLIKYDMSEYQERHSISEMIGSPPGYVGYEDGKSGSGSLINALDENPNCVILLDEIEKAHPKLFDVFLQIMDDGRVTSSGGKEVSASSAMLIMTSNAGAADAEGKNRMGFGNGGDDEDASAEVQREAIRKMFAPEFRNRLDAMIMFRKLDRATLRKIASKFLRELSAIAKKSGVSVSWSKSAIDWIVDHGSDSKMGARPMRRVIDRHVKMPLAKRMLFDDFSGKAGIAVEKGKLMIK